MKRKPIITCLGDDGVTTFRYFALCETGLHTNDIGWVLAVEGPEPLDPQRLTPTEVADDLRSMGLGDDDVLFTLLRMSIEEMVGQLEASGAPAAHVAALRRELDQLPRGEPA